MNRLLCLNAAAEYLGMTAHGLRKIVKRGGIVYFQSGRRGRLRFKTEWLDDYIAQHTHQPRQFTPTAGRKPKAVNPSTKPESNQDRLGFRDDLYKH